jgi:exodeoxyribonuclease-5
MELTQKQLEGLEIAVQRFKENKPYTCIAGYAGTGKSTLISFIISALGVSPYDVCYIAYTGKAANVLRQKGCANAKTAHKLLYTFKPLPNGKYVKQERDVASDGYKVIVVDEVSMLPLEMWQLLLSHKIYILATGDPGQLPPIEKETDNHVLDNPHIFLDEVMRQAYDSEIIRLSMWIREGKPLADFPQERKQVQIITKNDLVTGMYEWADQILCSTNSKRAEINNIVRQLRGYGSEPEVGDRIISLRNHWDFISARDEQPLTNGCIGTLEEGFWVSNYPIPKYVYDKPMKVLYGNMKVDEDIFMNIGIDYEAFFTKKPTLNSKQEYALMRKKMEPPYQFDYAYAITCHKAQGSEWDKVLVFEEWYPNTEEEHKRWLYTAATRAKEKLVIVRK